ncbi:MAG TPA: hypothetical protein VN408_07825 [Actinoplanes sp.]|nr:hypothetical protein [Actinoplanes sp.]
MIPLQTASGSLVPTGAPVRVNDRPSRYGPGTVRRHNGSAPGGYRTTAALPPGLRALIQAFYLE